MKKLNRQKESIIEILKIIENKMLETWPVTLQEHPDGTTVVEFNVYFYIQDFRVRGDVYFKKIGRLK